MASNFRIFRDYASACADAGPALARDNQRWIFDRGEWFELAARHTLEGEPLVIKGEAGGSNCWLFLEQLGSTANALSNWYSLRFNVITSGPNPPVGALVDGLKSVGAGHIMLDPTGPMDELSAQLKRAGWLVRREEINVSWQIDTSAMSFEQYWDARPSRLKNTYKRKVKKAGLDCVIHHHLDEGVWADVTQVFDNSWKKPDGTPEMTHDLFAQEAQAGTLRVGLAYKDGAPVAAQLWTIENGLAIIHLLSYREDSKDLSAGTILSHEMFRHALDEAKASRIDFGYGDHAYKREWMDERVPLYAITAYHLLSWSGLKGFAAMIWRKVISRLPGSKDA